MKETTTTTTNFKTGFIRAPNYFYRWPNMHYSLWQPLRNKSKQTANSDRITLLFLIGRERH